jgi:hypothetical protein
MVVVARRPMHAFSWTRRQQRRRLRQVRRVALPPTGPQRVPSHPPELKRAERISSETSNRPTGKIPTSNMSCELPCLADLYHGRAPDLAGPASVPTVVASVWRAGGGVRLESSPGLDEVLEDGHEEEERDEDGRGCESEGDGVHRRAEVLERGLLAPRVSGRGNRLCRRRRRVSRPCP